MNKLKSIVAVLFVVFLIPLIASAGSVPEDLLHYNDAQIFFAEVVYYHPNKSTPDIEVCPVEVIKGDVKKGVKLTYLNPNAVGNFKVKAGNVYLFAYFDENNPTDIFYVKNNGNDGLKLMYTEGDMWRRFEKYLNEGEYFKAEQERRIRQGLPLLIDNPVERGYLPYLNKHNDYEFYYVFGAFVILAAVLVIIIAAKKRRR